MRRGDAGQIANFAGEDRAEHEIYDAIGKLYDGLEEHFAGSRQESAALKAVFPEAPVRKPWVRRGRCVLPFA